MSTLWQIQNIILRSDSNFKLMDSGIYFLNSENNPVWTALWLIENPSLQNEEGIVMSLKKTILMVSLIFLIAPVLAGGRFSRWPGGFNGGS